MKFDEAKAVLSSSDSKSLEKACSAAVEELLRPEQHLTNVVGVGMGVKWKNGMPTGEPSVVVLVSQKLSKDAVNKSEMVPGKFQETQTDVLSVGNVFAGLSDEIGIQTLAKRARPAQGGYSVGHKNITAGTIGTCGYRILPGGSVSPPVHGAGIPPQFFILSNNHVLANSNAASIGDAVLQPGPIDGGADPADRIATLSAFVPITFNPPVALSLHNNLVDAALAEGQFHDINREIFWSGPVRGWRRKANVIVGTLVKKTGRTTNFTVGRVTVVNATVDVNYGGGKAARFKDQILTTPMSAGGDSGSLITTLDNVAIGLLFAGSAAVTIANQIENVRALLGVEVAEQIL